MIYLDNAATTLHKPPEVAEAVKNAILTAGNASRGAHGVSLSASRMVFETRSQLAKLFGCPRADHVVFTANSTEALNIAIYGLFSSGDHVISTDLEHNSVLRPLYDLQTRGVSVDFVPADRQGNIRYEDMETLFRPETTGLHCLPICEIMNLVSTGNQGRCLHACIQSDRKPARYRQNRCNGARTRCPSDCRCIADGRCGTDRHAAHEH